jgi:hypothetical protein
MKRSRDLSMLLVLCAAGTALAHRIPGVKPMSPGDPFHVAGFRGLMRGLDGHYVKAPINLDALRDQSPWIFLSFDPNAQKDVAEAKRFEATLKTLPHTHGFLVIPPALSLLADHSADLMTKTGLTLPTILDDRDIIPYAFRHELDATPRYNALDQSQTLVVQNAVSLSQKTPTGETFADLLRHLDQKETVSPWVISAIDQKIEDGRE